MKKRTLAKVAGAAAAYYLIHPIDEDPQDGPINRLFFLFLTPFVIAELVRDRDWGDFKEFLKVLVIVLAPVRMQEALGS